MKNKIRKSAVLMSVLAVVFTVCVCVIDRQPIGPNSTVIGFASLNKAVFEGLGVHMAFYEITEVLGYVSIAVCVFFACLGLAQAFKRKSLFKLDRDIFALAGIYVLTIILYVLFEKLAINYRPIIMPGSTETEASFPSSHTMLICTVMGTTIIEAGKRVKNSMFRTMLIVICAVIAAVTVVGRLVCGVHWATDIFGGILYSLSLIFWFIASAYKFED